jgi:hypothetical protein
MSEKKCFNSRPGWKIAQSSKESTQRLSQMNEKEKDSTVLVSIVLAVFFGVGSTAQKSSQHKNASCSTHFQPVVQKVTTSLK